jgi:hypothetical protein
MALGRTTGRMSSVAAKQQAAQQQTMAQRAVAQQQQRAAALATNRLDRPLGAAPQQPAAMPKQVAGQMAAFNAAQNKTTQGFNDAQLQQLQQEKMLREQQNQRYLGNPAAQDQLNQSPNNLARLSPTPTNSNSAPFTPQKVTDPAIRQALLNAPKPSAMRKGGAVKKKPGYAKGGMVMANCGASMKPQQKAKK